MNEFTTHDEQHSYHEIQRSWWTWLIFAIVLVEISIPLLVPIPREAGIAMMVGAGVITVIAFAFASLTISDTVANLRVQFGPLPLAGTEIPYNEILEIEQEKSTFLDGWGLRRVRGGWLWNVWGYDCIKVVTEKKTVRIGTQKPEELLAFLLLKTEKDSTHSNFSPA